MNHGSIALLKVLRNVYLRFGVKPKVRKPFCIDDADVASEHILKALSSDGPAMIARFGSNELTCLANYVGVHSERRSWIAYVQGRAQPWWWNESILHQMSQCAGFFPANFSALEHFCELMIQDMPCVDVLGSWLSYESMFDQELSKSVKVELELLNPYFSRTPWTQALKGKRVLVVHPFSETIESQYKKRELLFENDVLPEFQLRTIKAVQSIAGQKTSFSSWFSALDSMKAEMDREDYDICLIGCGAYGFPLAAHAKRNGKKGVHLGGSLQLLFGIIGKRWESPDYNPVYNYSRLINEHWVRPGISETPVGAQTVEGACYW